MPRPRQFDPETALDGAMQVFWQKGFAATSMDDLVSATGVSRYGLYGEFQSKEALYLRCLDHYNEIIVSRIFGPVEDERAGLDDIRDYFNTLLHATGDNRRRLGCLMVNNANDVAPFFPSAAKYAASYRTRLRAGFERALQNSVESEQGLSPERSSKTADYLTGVVMGFSVMVRSGADPAILENFISIALDTLTTKGQ